MPSHFQCALLLNAFPISSFLTVVVYRISYCVFASVVLILSAFRTSISAFFPSMLIASRGTEFQVLSQFSPTAIWNEFTSYDWSPDNSSCIISVFSEASALKVTWYVSVALPSAFDVTTTLPLPFSQYLFVVVVTSLKVSFVAVPTPVKVNSYSFLVPIFSESTCAIKLKPPWIPLVRSFRNSGSIVKNTLLPSTLYVPACVPSSYRGPSLWFTNASGLSAKKLERSYTHTLWITGLPSLPGGFTVSASLSSFTANVISNEILALRSSSPVVFAVAVISDLISIKLIGVESVVYAVVLSCALRIANIEKLSTSTSTFFSVFTSLSSSCTLMSEAFTFWTSMVFSPSAFTPSASGRW